MIDQDRIRLAEAMGIHLLDRTNFYPFSDANDDYAVLEWMRRERKISYRNIGQSYCYQIGDYARSALKVIDND